MNKNKRLPRRPAKAIKTSSELPIKSRKKRWIRYGVYALVVLAAVAVRFWLTGPEVPTPPLTDLDPALVEEIENARAEIWESPREPEKWGRLGMLLAAHSYPIEAVQCFEHAEVLDPASWKWPYLRSIAQEQSDRAASLDALSQAAETAGDDEPFPRLLLVERLMETGERDEAEQHLQIALRHWPEHPRAHLNQARLLSQRGNAQAALAALNKATSDRHTRRTAHQLLIQIHRRLGDDAATSAALARLEELPPDEAWRDRWREALDGFRISKGAYIARINELARRGDYDRLARTTAETIERFPELAHLVTGRERLSRGDLVGAERALREAVELDPKSVDALVSLGEALLRQDKIAAAVESFRKATRLEPMHGEAYLRLGQALAKQDQQQESLASFRSAVQFMPTSPKAHRALAEALSAVGQGSAAEEHRRHAERLTKE
ncbi:MAG: tetratricopeptide repeat protein [Pirellulales bacterium]